MQTLLLNFKYIFTAQENKTLSSLSVRLNFVSKVIPRIKALGYTSRKVKIKLNNIAKSHLEESRRRIQ